MLRKELLVVAKGPRVQHVRAVFSEAQGSQSQCRCDRFPSAQRQNGLEEDT